MSAPTSTPIFNNSFIYNEQIIKTAVTRTTSHVLTNSGRLYSWGASSFVTTNAQTTNTWNSLGLSVLRTASPIPVKINCEKNITDICAGYAHVSVLTSTNKIYWWGIITTSTGVSLMTTTIPTSLSLSALGANIPKKIFCGYSSIFVIDNNNNVYSIGRNSEGVLGNGGTTDSTSFSKLIYFSSVPATLSLSTTFQTVLTLQNDGTLITWGRNTNSQIGDNGVSPSVQPSPTQIPIAGTDLAGKSVTSIAASYEHSIALSKNFHTIFNTSSIG